ncbi:hypothetical protein D030_0633B, partial [Vibrio parahaemolyticus AQ3810]
ANKPENPDNLLCPNIMWLISSLAFVFRVEP